MALSLSAAQEEAAAAVRAQREAAAAAAAAEAAAAEAAEAAEAAAGAAEAGAAAAGAQASAGAPCEGQREEPRLLVSTEGACRGLDLPQLDVVLLLHVPATSDAYLHLAGRTGRLGRSGRVVSLLTPYERNGLGTLTRQLGISIRPDAELALAIARDESPPPRHHADEAHAQSSAPRPEAAVAVAAPPVAGDTPWDLPEVGGGDEDTAFDGW